jgi:hypothetical protein
MEVTSSFKTQIGGDDDEESKKRKKRMGFVALLIVALSVTAWFFVQPLLEGEKPVAVAPVAKNPAKAAAAEGTAVDKAVAQVAGEISQAEASADAIRKAALTATSEAPSVSTAPPVAADASTTASESSYEASLPALPPPPEIPILPDTSAVSDVAVAIPTAATTAATIAPSAVKPSAPPLPPPGPLTTAEPVPTADESGIEILADQPLEPVEKVDEVVDRWEKLRSENPGTVLPSNDMWVFQTRKLKSKIYVVKRAESLKAISTKLLYSDRFWVKIWSLNPAVLDPEVVPVGTEIVIDPSARGTASH